MPSACDGRAACSRRRSECGARPLARGALAEFRFHGEAGDELDRLAELRQLALEYRLEADVASGNHATAIPELRLLVHESPLRESLRGSLMLALYRAGRQAEALAVYTDTRSVLVAELGIEPSESLQHLQAAILAQDPSLRRAGPTTWPAYRRYRNRVPNRARLNSAAPRHCDEFCLATLISPARARRRTPDGPALTPATLVPPADHRCRRRRLSAPQPSWG